MITILIALLTDFFKDALPLADILFNKLIDIVFFVEKHLSDGSIFDNTFSETTGINLFFENIYKVSAKIGIGLMIVKFLKKILDVYMLGSDGDSSVSLENMLIGFIKGISIILCFNFGYEIFVNISVEIIDEMLSVIGMTTLPSLSTIFMNVFLGGGFFVLLGVLTFFICFILLILQFIRRGIEMFVLRVGIPFACTGLIDSDNGMYSPYIKRFIQNSVTVLVQLALLKLSFGVISNGNIFFGIGVITMALKTPQFLQEFVVHTNGSMMNMSSINQTVTIAGKVGRFLKNK